jgi:hypothetical protein
MPAAHMRVESTLCATRIRKESTRMHAGSTRMSVQYLYFNMIDIFFIIN